MNRIGRRAAMALLTTTLLASLIASPVAAAEPSFTAAVVQLGLTVPWDIAFVPDGRMIVTERPGRVRVYRDGNRNAALLRTTTIASVRAEGEAGLMGVAVDPDFSTRPYLYLCASRQVDGTWRNQVLRYRLLGDSTLSFDGYVIRWNMIAAAVHNGCAVEIGPDRMVYVSMGDAAQAGLAQDSASNNGKVLRATRNGGIPADNPVFPGQTTPSYVWSKGHRNPQGLAFEPGTGRLYAIEHGPDRDDEINWIRAGRNYGWPDCAGSGCGFTPPIWESNSPTIATSGGAFVSGSNWGDASGDLFVATLKEQDLRRFDVSADSLSATNVATLYDGAYGRLRAVARLGNRLYLSTSNGSNDRIVRIISTTP